MAIEKFVLYEDGLTTEQLFDLRFTFWRTLDGFFGDNYYAEFDYSLMDENGNWISNYIPIPKQETAPEFADGVYYRRVGTTSYDYYALHDEPENWEGTYTDYYITAAGFGIFSAETNQPIFNALGNGCGVFILRDGQAYRSFGCLQAIANQWKVAYKTDAGVMIVIKNVDTNTDGGVIIIAKTNKDNLAVVCKEAGAYQHLCAVNAHVWAENDAIPDNNDIRFTFMPDSDSTHTNTRSGEIFQTVLCPIATHREDGTVSYLRGVYALPWAQYRGKQGVLTLNGKRYVTNGYYALIDE